MYIKKTFLELAIFVLCQILTFQLSNCSSLSYVGAVVEYSPAYDIEDGKNIRDINTENYLKFIEKAFEYSVDILVFPESSLSLSSSQNKTIRRSEAASYIPDSEDKIIPCTQHDNYANSLINISCAAMKYKMYIVINHREKCDCNGDNCPDDGLLIYNTNVVFDRSGKIIEKYRKYNLFGEFDTNKTSNPFLSTFETDFGVTFGQIICFDIMFEKPALNLIRDLDVKDIIFSSRWYSEMPYLYSVQVQAGWSYANDVNLLASGHSNPLTASGGSGIYIGRSGYTKIILENKASNILFVSEIPKVINGQRLLNINEAKNKIYNFSKSEISTTGNSALDMYVHTVDDLTPYTTKLINYKFSKFSQTICDRNLCCDFKLKISLNDNHDTNDNNYYRYRITVFNGTRNFTGLATGGVKICGIISCTDNTIETCGKFFDPNIKINPSMTFESIHISMENMKNGNNFFMPVSFTTSRLPLNSTEFSFENINFNNTSVYNMNLKKTRNDLITFAIHGRNFATDSSEVTVTTST